MSSYWDRATQPYAATFWFATACSIVSVLLVPFLSLTTQGGKAKEVSVASSVAAVPGGEGEKEAVASEQVLYSTAQMAHDPSR